MNVYFFDELDGFACGEYIHLMPPQRRLTFEKYKRDVDKKLCAAAFLLLRMALLREYGIKEVPPMTNGVHGKPYFANRASLFFNMSHCEGGAVCVVGQRENGVDIQDIRRVEENVMKRVMCPEELKFISQSGDKERAFAYLWSRKEAFVKKDGRGIAQDLKSVNTLELPDIKTYDGGSFFISAAPAKKISLIKIKASDFEDLKA